MYADDTQLYISFDSGSRDSELSKLKLCTNDVMTWCSSNGLMFNPGKTGDIYLSSRHRDYELIKEIWVGGASISPTPATRDLRVTVNSKLQLDKHVNNICKSASFAFKNIGTIRRFLSQSDYETMHPNYIIIITSKLDYCNAILYGLPKSQLDNYNAYVQKTLQQDW